ncbi:unnamed protein product, partial [Medioppia subpectinata]
KVRYPKPGRSNPTIKLHYIDLTQLHDYNGSIGKLTVHLKPPKDITDYGDHYLTTLKWIDDNVVAANWMNRAQNFSVMTCYSSRANLEPISNFKLQSSNGWIDLFKPPVVTPDRESYILRVPKMSDNKKDVFPHIAKVSVSSAESSFLTSGIFEVKEILSINPETDKIYFMATLASNPGEKHLMSAPLNESSAKTTPVCHTCLMNTYTTDKNKTCLVSDVEFSEGAKHYILNCLGPHIPRSEIRSTADDRLLYTLKENKQLKNKTKGLSLPKRILMKVPVGGYEIDVMLYVPHDFDSKSKQKYPLVFNVYGGPGSDSGSVSQNYFYNQFGAYLVSNKSVIYAYLDTRGSASHGSKFMFEIYRRLGTVEVDDTIEVARYFRDKVPYIDSKSIAIWGWSYGGYVATKALENDYNDTV